MQNDERIMKCRTCQYWKDNDGQKGKCDNPWESLIHHTTAEQSCCYWRENDDNR